MTDPTPIVTALDRAGYRMTEPRRSLAALIAEQDGHFTAADLVTAGRATRPAFGRATVFRTLDLLEGIGAVESTAQPRARRLAGRDGSAERSMPCSLSAPGIRCMDGRRRVAAFPEHRRTIATVARAVGHHIAGRAALALRLDETVSQLC